MTKGEWGKIKAFFDIRTSEGFVIKGFKIIEGINGLFVGMPSQKGNDDEYFDTTYAERELKDELSQMAIDYYGQDIMPTNNNQSNEMGEPSMSTVDSNEKPQHNADTPAVTDDDIPF